MTNTSLQSSCLRVVAGAAFAVSISSNAAKAGPVESLVSIAQHPTDEQVLVLQYQDGLGGLLFSRNGGSTFQIHPSMAFTPYGTRSYVPVQFAGDGKLLLGLTDGLALDNGHGCAITVDPTLQKHWVRDLARHPSDPNVTFILTSGDRKLDASRTGVWKRDVNGVITPLAGNDTNTTMGTPAYGRSLFLTKSLSVVARSQSTEGLRILEAGNKNSYPDAMSVVQVPTFRYSDDLGASWTEHAVAMAEAVDDVTIVAVTAGEPMKVVLAVQKTGATNPLDIVLLSNDGGATFSRYIEGINAIGQAVVTPDGRFFMADMGTANACVPAGLWFAPEVGAPAERVVDYPVRCLGYDAEHGALYMCKGYEFGLFFPNERAYCRLMELNDVDGFVSCSGTDDLSMNAAVNEQVCGGWCGQVHLASSPFCASTSCVEESLAYDRDAGWVEPPGVDAPSCAGFVPADANSPRTYPGCDSDGGPGRDAGGDAGGSTGDMDAGARSDAGGAPDDAGSPAGDGATGGSRDGSMTAPDAGSETEPPVETDDGCDCSVRAGHQKLPDLAGLGVGLWLLARGVRTRKRRNDA
jgi:hypothetical protein